MATTVGELIKMLKTQLVPRGTEPIVKLQLGNYGYVSENLIKQAIDQLERQFMMGDEASPLEKLGIMLLLDSVGYDSTKQ